ncbi:alpha/beta hydrolase [Sulfurospirillum sp. 1612]|uniref:alpha/beta hydrolase n=1 Tax=Sulfurospirillum sp. 1612 TaxID=3094835 RepID=UPI002F93B753
MKKLFLIVLLFMGLNLFSGEIQLKTQDGFVLKGWLTYPKVSQKSYPLALFAHEFGSTHKMWAKISQLMREKGYATFEMDLRGHGVSDMQNGKKNAIVHFKTIDQLSNAVKESAAKVDFKKIPSDLSAWIDKLSENPKLQTEDMVFFGSSLGGGAIISILLDYEPKVVVLFSPAGPKEYNASDIDDAISNSEAKILLVSSREDFALGNTIDYMKKALTPTLLVVPGSGHGSATFDLAMPFLKTYLDKYLPKR